MKVNIKKVTSLEDYNSIQKKLVNINKSLLYNYKPDQNLTWRKQKIEYIKQLRTFEKEYMEYFV